MNTAKRIIPISRGRLTFLLTSALLICIAVSTVILIRIRRESIYAQGIEISSMVDNISDDFMNYVSNSELRASIEKSYRSQMDVIEGVVRDMDIMNMSALQRKEAADFFYKLREISDARELYIVDSTGNLTVSIYSRTLGKNLVSMGRFTPEQMSRMVAEARKEEVTDRNRIAVDRSDGKLYFFSQELKDKDGAATGTYMLMGCDADEIDRSEENAMDNYMLMDLGYDNNKLMDFAVLRLSDEKLIYATDRIKDGTHPFDLTARELKEFDGQWNLMEIAGVEHECYSRTVSYGENGDVVVVGIAHSEYAEATDSRTYSNVYFLAPVFLLLAILLIIYGYVFERKSTSMKLGKGLFGGVMLICTALFFVIAYFLISLRQVTETVYLAENGLQLLGEKTEEAEVRKSEMIDYYKAKDLTATEVIALSIGYASRNFVRIDNGYPYYRINSEGEYEIVKDSFGNDLVSCPQAPVLKDKVGVMESSRIWIINEKGYAIASSSDKWRLSLNEMEDGEELRKVMFLEEKNIYKFLYDDSGHAVGTRIAYPIEIYSYSDGEGNTRYASYSGYLSRVEAGGTAGIKKTRGLLLIDIDGTPKALRAMDLYVNETMKAALNDVGCSFIRISESDPGGRADKKIRLCDGMDADLSFIDVPERMKQEKFNFIREISKKKYFIHMEHDSRNQRYVALVFDNSAIHRERMVGVLRDTAIAFFGFLLLMFLVIGTRGADDYLGSRANDSKVAEGDSRGVVLLKRFLQKNPEERLMISLEAVMVAFITFVILLFASRSGEGQEWFFTDIYSGEFERAVNFYNISAALGVLVAIVICFSLIKKVVDIICDPLGEKFETYATLTVTIFQCMLLFCGLFYGAYLLGMEIKSIGTMATVVAGAIGLGSKEIIADITAGIQIVTGGKVVLGDTICVDGFTGVVKEIRLRCCMIENRDGMIKSVPNSKMISVVVIQRGKKKNI